MAGDVIVWGNCQAAPVAELLSGPLAAAGLNVRRVPPVYLATPDDVARVHATVRGCAVLVSQPVRDEYATPGCGTSQLAALLPPGARLVTFPVVHHGGRFPYQVHGYDGTGRRVDAPLTDYHDLRMLAAAAAGATVSETVTGWPAPSADAIRAVRVAADAELRRREHRLDVRVTGVLDRPDALWTMTHPDNAVLAVIARSVLDRMGLSTPIEVPAREYLAARRSPLEAPVCRAHGWADDAARPQWTIDGRLVPLPELARVQLAFYAARPDVVSASLARHADTAALLALAR